MTQGSSHNLCLIVGILLFASSPVIFLHNRAVTEIRQDLGTASYDLRSDLFIASVVCGFGLVCVGWGGRREARRVTGQLAKLEASYTYMPVLVLGAAFGCRALLALAYIRTIYATSAPIRRNVMSLAMYWRLSIGLLCAGLLLAILFMVQRARHVGRSKSEYEPICANCGYSLRGIAGSRCPECGYTGHTLDTQEAKKDHKAG